VVEALRVLHQEVSDAARVIERKLPFALQCGRGCSGCCADGITVFDVEADAIRAAHPELLERGTPHPEGKCAFLDAAGACRIYDVRPYVCRTQGLPLRWEDPEQGVEHRDICPLNEGDGVDIVGLPVSACWTLGPTEARLAGMARTRVPLRSLFGASAQ